MGDWDVDLIFFLFVDDEHECRRNKIHSLDNGIPQLFCTTNSRQTMRVSGRNPFYVELFELPLEAIHSAPFVGVPC